METLGERIRIIRTENKLSQTEFGKLFDVVKGTVSSWETENSSPNDEIKNKICSKFDITMDWLLCRTDIRKSEIKPEYPKRIEDNGFYISLGSEATREDIERAKEAALLQYELDKRRKEKKEK